MVYAQCCECRQGKYPLLEEMRVDQEGFTQALQELSLLAGVIEPYRSASEQLLRKFTGVVVSSEKIQSLVGADGKKAEGFSKEPANEVEAGTGRRHKGPLYIGIDGGMVFVDGPLAGSQARLPLYRARACAEQARTRRVDRTTGRRGSR